jgi:hypothetical protein
VKRAKDLVTRSAKAGWRGEVEQLPGNDAETWQGFLVPALLMEWATVSEEVVGLLKSFAGLFAQASRRDEVT